MPSSNFCLILEISREKHTCYIFTYRVTMVKSSLKIFICIVVGISLTNARYNTCWPNGSICARSMDCCTGECDKIGRDIIGKVGYEVSRSRVQK